ncbi:MAG: hypothetical protein IKH89_08310 [Bacteroidales bacterium]|nr:hypothetical protein [Bacteroidales bacterium]
MNSYLLLLEKQFSINGVGKKLSNSFIDMTNVALVDTLHPSNIIVLTNDREWRYVLMTCDYPGKEQNVNFYSQFSL